MVIRRARWLVMMMLLLAGGQASCGLEPSPIGVGSFDWVVTPSLDLTIHRGSPGSFTIRLNSKVNINSDVELGLSGTIPANSNPTFNPARLGSTGRDSTLTFQTTAQTPEGSYSLVITANEIGFGTSQQFRRVDVVSGTGPDFTLEVEPAEITLTRSGASTVAFYVRPRNGFTGSVDISVESPEASAPSILVRSPTPAQIPITSGAGAGGTFVIGLAERPSFPPSVTLTVRATSGSIVHTRQLIVNIRLAAP